MSQLLSTVEEISKKVQESRLKWQGHVTRRRRICGKKIIGGGGCAGEENESKAEGEVDERIKDDSRGKGSLGERV